MPHVGRSCGDACWGSSGSAPLMSWFCGTFRAMPVSQAAGMSAGPLHRLAFLSVKIEEIGEKKNEGGKKKKGRKGRERKEKLRREVFKDKNLLHGAGFREADTFLDAKAQALSRKCQFLSK